MIEHSDIDQGECVSQTKRDEFVGSTWLGNARGVIVGEDEARRVMSESLSYDLAGVHARPVDRAAKQLLEGDQPMPGIEIEAAEHLEGSIPKLRDQKSGGFSG